MPHQFFIDQRPHNGMSYNAFIAKSMNRIESTDINSLNENEKQLFEYIKLNMHRSARIEKTYKVSDDLLQKLHGISEPQLWMVITEAWCGDSAQNLPYIAKMAACNPRIDLRIIFRDENLDIMDQYLTDGKSRSIPKLVAFNKEGDELFQWGPRPKATRDMVAEAKEEGLPKNEFIEQLHLWYAKNKGAAIEDEFLQLL